MPLTDYVDVAWIPATLAPPQDWYLCNDRIPAWCTGEGGRGWAPQHALGGHYGAVVDMGWDAQGRCLHTVSEDQTARIFSTCDAHWCEIARPQVRHCGSSMNSAPRMPGLDGLLRWSLWRGMHCSLQGRKRAGMKSVTHTLMWCTPGGLVGEMPTWHADTWA